MLIALLECGQIMGDNVKNTSEIRSNILPVSTLKGLNHALAAQIIDSFLALFGVKV